MSHGSSRSSSAFPATHDDGEPADGARPLRRYIAREVETAIGRALLGGDAGEGAVVIVDAKGGELIVTYSSPPEGEEVA